MQDAKLQNQKKHKIVINSEMEKPETEKWKLQHVECRIIVEKLENKKCKKAKCRMQKQKMQKLNGINQKPKNRKQKAKNVET